MKAPLLFLLCLFSLPALASKFKSDRGLLRSRAQTALQLLLKQKFVDPKKLLAMGYCFGGTTVLELARSGADLRGIVSFHGGLDNPRPQDAKNIRAKVLILHGALDPFVKPSEVAAFQKEMNEANVDYQIISYSNTVHAFTVPAAGSNPAVGAAYNPVSEKRSIRAMRAFFDEIPKQE